MIQRESHGAREQTSEFMDNLEIICIERGFEAVIKYLRELFKEPGYKTDHMQELTEASRWISDYLKSHPQYRKNVDMFRLDRELIDWVDRGEK